MKHEYLSCDHCNASSINGGTVRSYRIEGGKEMDASGNGYVTNWIYKDFCDNCCEKFTLNNSEIKILPL